MPAANPTAEPLILNSAEMAVVFQHLLGPAASEGGLLGDLNLQPRALDSARGRLLERGLLRPAPNRAIGKTFIAPSVRTLFGAVTRPLMLCVLHIMRPGQEERGAYFCWTPEVLVFNTVDAHGNHRLQTLPDLEAVADRALAECGLDTFKPQPTPMPSGPDALGRAASLRAIIMTVASARTAHENVHGLAWLVSAGRLWLMSPQAAGADGTKLKTTPAPGGLRPILPADLRVAILAAAQRAVEHTQAALEAAAA